MLGRVIGEAENEVRNDWRWVRKVPCSLALSRLVGGQLQRAMEVSACVRREAGVALQARHLQHPRSTGLYGGPPAFLWVKRRGLFLSLVSWAGAKAKHPEMAWRLPWAVAVAASPSLALLHGYLGKVDR